jgi:hypothetical protein|tara:strand:+ start:267 stop:491 length:225 start_codon:yes stop_codon:yes gene_type:complete
MEGIIIVLAGLVALFASCFVYIDLLGKDKIKPHIPPRYRNRDTRKRGNFWDAETQMFYKWHQIEELKKIRGVKK